MAARLEGYIAEILKMFWRFHLKNASLNSWYKVTELGKK